MLTWCVVTNSGAVIDFFEITDYEQASREFAEGDKSLEQLLMICFRLRIATRSCCAGHRKNQPMIVLENYPQSRPYIINIIKHLYDTGCLISYTCAIGDLDASWSFRDKTASIDMTTSEDVWKAMDGVNTPKVKIDMFDIMNRAIIETNAKTQLADLTIDAQKFVQLVDLLPRRDGQGFRLKCHRYDRENHRYEINSSGPSYMGGDKNKEYSTTALSYLIEGKDKEQMANLLGKISFESMFIKLQ